MKTVRTAFCFLFLAAMACVSDAQAGGPGGCPPWTIVMRARIRHTIQKVRSRNLLLVQRRRGTAHSLYFELSTTILFPYRRCDRSRPFDAGHGNGHARGQYSDQCRIDIPRRIGTGTTIQYA